MCVLTSKNIPAIYQLPSCLDHISWGTILAWDCKGFSVATASDICVVCITTYDYYEFCMEPCCATLNCRILCHPEQPFGQSTLSVATTGLEYKPSTLSDYRHLDAHVCA
jgi:hypothetical protein